MKVVYTKLSTLKLLGKFPLWVWREDYLEHSREGDDDDGRLDIDLKERTLNQ